MFLIETKSMIYCFYMEFIKGGGGKTMKFELLADSIKQIMIKRVQQQKVR